MKLPKDISFEELSSIQENIVVKYNQTPHGTLENKTPDQVFFNFPTNARQLLYQDMSQVQEQVQQDARKGHEKYIKVIEKLSAKLYNSIVMPKVGDTVMVLHPSAYKNRRSVIKSYLGAGSVTRVSTRNSSMFYVRWLHNGNFKDVKKDLESARPYPNQYVIYQHFFFLDQG